MTENNSVSFVDKFLDSSVSNIISILTALIISACGYMLFQYSLEYQSIQQQKFELDHKYDDLRYVWEIGDIFTEGWFYTSDSRENRNNIIIQFTIHREDPDPQLDTKTMQWILNSISDLNKERTTISGYVIDKDFANGLPFEIQQSLINIYDTRLNEFNLIQSMIIKWEFLTTPEKREQLIQLADAVDASNNSINELSPKLNQFNDLGITEAERFKYLEAEYDLRENNVVTKKKWAIGGIIASAIIFIPIILLKLFSKQNSQANSSVRKRHRQKK